LLRLWETAVEIQQVIIKHKPGFPLYAEVYCSHSSLSHNSAVEIASVNSTINLELIAAARPPEGVQSNFINPPNFDNAAIATVVLCILTTTLALIARLVTKIYLIKQVAAEDCMFGYSFGPLPLMIHHSDMVSIAWAIFMGYNSIVLKNGFDGYDRHQWDVSAASAIRVAKVQFNSSDVVDLTDEI
jgi:hypothetical protein